MKDKIDEPENEQFQRAETVESEIVMPEKT